MLSTFRRDRKGNFSIVFAMTLPVILGSVGLAVDVATMTNAHSRLQEAVDAAVLAASRINDKTISRKTMYQDFLAANLTDAETLKNVTGDLDVETGLNYISTTGWATAEIDLNFGFLFGKSKHVKASASAYESRNNLEVVLALDNTGSMGSYRMGELRKAATSLIDILSLVHSPDTEPKRVVKAALVPFVTAVNVKGTGFKESWIDGHWDAVTKKYRTTVNTYHGRNFNKIGSGKNKRYPNHFELFDALGNDNFNKKVQWKGCVEARPGQYNLSDASPDPAVGDTMFVPYFAPDNPGVDDKSPNKSGNWNNSYLKDSFGSGDQDKVKNSTRYSGVAQNDKYIDENSGSRTTGPNYACPTPIEPLTSDFDKLKTEISKMIYWEGSGTNVSEGLAWSYRVLSPGEPYTAGAPFKSESNSKYVVVFTDGENQVFGASGEPYNKSDYGSYGFLDDNRLGETDRAKALTKVNTMTLDMCTSLKAQDVEVFTVLLGADTPANRELYTKCATTPDHYYPTSDVDELDAVFKRIASRIAKLYITN